MSKGVGAGGRFDNFLDSGQRAGLDSEREQLCRQLRA